MSSAKAVLSCVMEVVTSETDVAVSKIMSRCSEAEIVDARWMCVKILSEQGYYPTRIAELMGVTPRYVQYILTDFEDRIAMSRVMRSNYERATKRLRNQEERPD